MTNWTRALILLMPALPLALVTAPLVRADIYSNEKLRVYSDVRGRLEYDWDSVRADGSPREDRSRFRIRFRVGFEYSGEHMTVGARLRSGADLNQQSSNITIIGFDENENGTRDTAAANFNFDRWYLKGRTGKFWIWAGRDDLPFWRQNEMFWDNDVTVAGVGGGWKSDVGRKGELTVNAGYYSNPAGMQAFTGNLALGQIVYSRWVGTRAGFTVAPALLWIASDAEDPDTAILLDGNGERDYTIWVLSLQGKLRAGDLPIRLGVDLAENTKDYPDRLGSQPTPGDEFTFENRDQTDGYVLSVMLGGAKEAGDWVAGYTYARIETLAVNSSYAQDDWVRWGTPNQSRNTNMRGHELRFGYAFSGHSHVLVRLYTVDAITTIEDGNRIRIDYNHKF